jgi:glycosyltransferase involved in cell wall biosynthesis
VRVYDWLAHTAISAAIYPYAALPNSAPATLARHPIKVLSAEARLRTLPGMGAPRMLVHREASPLSHGRLEEALLRSAHFSVYDFDDALQWDTGGAWYRQHFAKSAKCLRSVKEASRVVAGNETLANWATDFNSDVLVIPSCVEPMAYDQKTDFEVHDPPRLVWVGSPSTEIYLQSIRGPLLEIHRTSGARLRVVSAGNRQMGDLQVMIDRFEWTSAGSSSVVADSDVAIAPLTDTPYARGKCAYKILEYGASQIPVVASPVGANATAVAKLNALPASTPDEWVDAVSTLLDAPRATRRGMGLSAQAAVTREYSFAAWMGRWLSALDLTSAANRIT